MKELKDSKSMKGVKGGKTAHMEVKQNIPGDSVYKYGAAGQISLYLKNKGSAGSSSY